MCFNENLRKEFYGKSEKNMNETVKENAVVSKDEKRIRNNQLSYIIQAALEYFVSLLVSGAFLASILKNIGVSDAVTGVVTTLKSLAISVQFLAVLFIKPKSTTKRMVTTLHFINQIMFVTLYLIPYINVPQIVKVIVFIVMFLGAEIIYNAAHPFKLSWLMSYVPDKKRGRFTANKEIISLIGGIAFSYAMGALIDHFDAMGNSEMGFVLSGVTIFVLCILHLVSLICVKESKEEINEQRTAEKTHTIRSVIKATLFNRNFSKIILLDILWHIGTGLTVFLGTYQINELGFTLKYVAILTAMGSVSRILFSRAFGKFADKFSWAKMMMVCFVIGGISYLILTFTCPANGKIFYALYSIMHGIYMAGSNSGMMNIVFDYVHHEDRPYALGIKSAIGGLTGFLLSLVGAKVVSAVQANGNILFGRTIYAQQILAFITFLIFIFVALYIKMIIMKMKKVEE